MTDTAHLDPARKHTAFLLIEATDSNPNGDPDGANQPRTDPETGQGLLSDVSIKRKIRDTIPTLLEADATFDAARFGVFVEAGVALNTKLRAAADGVGRTLTKAAKAKATPAAKAAGVSKEAEQLALLRETYFDLRMFGGVLDTGDFPAGKLTGPVQVEWARSIDPVVATEHTITRVSRTLEADDANSQIGAKWVVPYGLYLTRVHYSPFDGRRAGVDSEDLRAMWATMAHMYEVTRSAARANISTAGLYIFSHRNPLGDASPRELGAAMKISSLSATPRSFDDYRVDVDTTGLSDNITLIRLV